MNADQINSRISYLTKTTSGASGSFNDTDRKIAANQAYNRVTTLIMQSDGRWQWDDTNQTDLPNATTSIVASQQDYSITAAHLKILRVEIKLNGATTFTKLDPIDQADTDLALDNVTTGAPSCYDIQGNSILLYPIPNYSQSASLKVFFQRGPVEFSSTLEGDTTTQPGFASTFHDLIPLWVAYDYAVANNLPQANGWMQEIIRLETELKAFYGSRDKDDPAQLTMKGINFR